MYFSSKTLMAKFRASCRRVTILKTFGATQSHISRRIASHSDRRYLSLKVFLVSARRFASFRHQKLSNPLAEQVIKWREWTEYQASCRLLHHFLIAQQFQAYSQKSGRHVWMLGSLPWSSASVSCQIISAILSSPQTLPECHFYYLTIDSGITIQK